MNFIKIEKCRICGSRQLERILSFGEHPPANALQDSNGENEERFPLTLAFCKKCRLVQILETVNKRLLFNQYFWVTGTSSTAREFANTFFEYTQRVTTLTEDALVIEVASNDGTFLQPFVEKGYKAIGVDSASNIVQIAKEKGINTINAFWDRAVGEELILEHGRAKLVFARNVIPHVSDLHSVIDGIRCCLDDDGVGAIEFHYVGHILQDLQYDSIYHEHLCYFSIKTIKHLLKMHGFYLFHIDSSPISGGAYIVYFRKNERQITETCIKLMEIENQTRVNELNAWKEFGSRCKKHREISMDLVDLFAEKTVLGFGASARSSTYLNFCGFNSSNIISIIDNNPLKMHKYTPGSSIRIVPFEEGLGMNPDLIFVLAWNFREEILRNCRGMGYQGPFLIPFPDLPGITE